MHEPLTSRQNPKVKFIQKLMKRRERDKNELFIIEGYRELKRAVESKISLTQLFICPELFLGSNEDSLIAQIEKSGVEVFPCTRYIFEKLSYRDRPDGLIAIAKQMQHKFSSIALSENSLIVVAESIEKPGNLGTILRSCDAVNATAVISCDRCTDLYNPNVVRASVGTLFTRPVIEAHNQEAYDYLKAHGFTLIAATPHATEFFTEIDYPGNIAIIVGTEQLGLSEFWMQKADRPVKIPMLGGADSLNVATATTLMIYEVLRQRHAT